MAGWGDGGMQERLRAALVAVAAVGLGPTDAVLSVYLDARASRGGLRPLFRAWQVVLGMTGEGQWPQ
jgi:hypothetical protein